MTTANGKGWRTTLFAWILVLPTLAALGAFTVYPAARSLVLSFYDTGGFSPAMTFVGLANYAEMAASPEYWQSLRTTALFGLILVPSLMLVSLALAVLLDAQPYVRSAFRTIFLLPLGVSPAMAAMLWIFLLNPTAGYLNYTLDRLGIAGPAWLASPRWALVAVCLVSLWKEVGFNVIFLLAGLAAVPDELHEAAYVDGASAWQRFRRVTLPLLSPTLFFVAIVTVIHALESFGQIHILTHGGPADATNVLVYQLYRDGFVNFRPTYASAQAVVLFVIILAATGAQFALARRRVHYR